MNRTAILGLFALLLSFSAYSQTQATFYTTMGNFDVELREDLVPVTANNFIDLADTMFYDGVIFHRVIANFMIQSGDPTGTGSGGPGYTIIDEFHFTLQHYKKGILSMANTGQPNTGGSQFFITLKATSWLDNKHSVFGEVIQGQEVVDSIGIVATDANDRPLTPVTIDSIRTFMATGRTKNIDNAQILAGSNFPNPFKESTTITYGLRQAMDVDFQVYDVNGRMVANKSLGNISAGDHQMEFDGKGLSAGLYTYRLITPQGSISKSMTIAK